MSEDQRYKQTLHKKLSFPLRISPVNVTKSAVAIRSFITFHVTSSYDNSNRSDVCNAEGNS